MHILYIRIYLFDYTHATHDCVTHLYGDILTFCCNLMLFMTLPNIFMLVLCHCKPCKVHYQISIAIRAWRMLWNMTKRPWHYLTNICISRKFISVVVFAFVYKLVTAHNLYYIVGKLAYFLLRLEKFQKRRMMKYY